MNNTLKNLDEIFEVAMSLVRLSGCLGCLGCLASRSPQNYRCGTITVVSLAYQLAVTLGQLEEGSPLCTGPSHQANLESSFETKPQRELLQSTPDLSHILTLITTL